MQPNPSPCTARILDDDTMEVILKNHNGLLPQVSL